MKTVAFKCSPLAPRALMAYDNHINNYPNGMMLNNGRSRNRIYGFKNAMYRIHETKTQVVIEEVEE